MTRLDALHELYFKYLATFYFDKARELLVRTIRDNEFS